MKTKFISSIVITLFVSSLVFSQKLSNKQISERWIQSNAKQLGIKSYHDFKLTHTRNSLSGQTLRYQQIINDVPVFQGEVVIHFSNNNQITHTSSSVKTNANNIDTQPLITDDEAFTKVKNQTNKIKGKLTYQEQKLFVWLDENLNTQLVYRIVTNSELQPGAWEFIVNAKTGEMVSTKDISLYFKDCNHKEKKAQKTSTLDTGTAYIFNPDPLSQTQSTYGNGEYVDGNDATNASLDAARTMVNIPELTVENGMYYLKNSYVEIKELESPTTGLFEQTSGDFLFNRNEQGFEAINAFWHLDNSLRYINITLGIDATPLGNNGVVWFDPHGSNGNDNSYYSNGTLVFGEGGVDDAEDADVILHELGHGIHDWITNGNYSQVQGLSEGSGDYWAQSYSRSLNQWQPTDAAYHYMFSWDGHNPFWRGRTTNYNATYPDDLVNSIHTDGQIWATACMKIYDIIGREKMDKAFLEGLSYTNSSTNQEQAAIAVRQAAIDMGYNCDEIQAFTDVFTATGYNLPNYNCNMAVNDLDSNFANIYPNPVKDILMIDLKNKKDEKVVIYNVNGQKVLETTLTKSKNSISVSNLIKGVYIIKFSNSKTSHKFIKN